MSVDNPSCSTDALGEPGDLALEEGPTVRGVQLGYQTRGTLNAVTDNAVLVTSGYSGNPGVLRETYDGVGRSGCWCSGSSASRWSSAA